MSEQRNYRRINFETEASIRCEEKPYQCKLVDLALQGALFTVSSELPIDIGKKCQLEIKLPASNLCMNFTGELIHNRGLFYGFIFVEEDAVTMGHLRRLLELNFGDGEEADREFLHWIKRH